MLTGQNIGNALYGLQCMDNSNEEVQRLLSVLLPKVISSQGYMSGSDIGMCMYGIMNMKDCNYECLNSITECLVNNAVQRVDSVVVDGMAASCEEAVMSEVLSLHQHMCFLFLDRSGLSAKHKSILQETDNKLLEYINNHVSSNNDLNKFKNDAEKKLNRVVSAMFRNAPCRILNNIYHLGFECDVLITSGNDVCINIECDGSVHDLKRKQKFCNLRDEYLRNNRVLVVRLSVREHLIGVSDETLKQTIANMLRQSKTKL